MLLDHLPGGMDGPAKLLHRLDDVIGRRHQHGRVRVVPGDQGRADRHTGDVSRPHGSPMMWSAASAGSCRAVSAR